MSVKTTCTSTQTTPPCLLKWAQQMTAVLQQPVWIRTYRGWRPLADKWEVTFEPSKCKAMTISRKSNPTNSALFFGTTTLAEMDELVILSVTIDKKLTWSKHISNITARAGQKLGALRRVSNKLDSKGRATVYKAQVHNVMECASLCWMSASSTTLQLLDSIQPEQSSADHWCGCTAGQDTAKHLPFTSKNSRVII